VREALEKTQKLSSVREALEKTQKVSAVSPTRLVVLKML
jgi:hypothetical protein